MSTTAKAECVEQRHHCQRRPDRQQPRPPVTGGLMRDLFVALGGMTGSVDGMYIKGGLAVMNIGLTVTNGMSVDLVSG